MPPEVGALGQAIATRLFSAGLALNSALSRIRDGPAADRVRQAVDDIDEAIRDVRRLMLSVQALGSAHQEPAEGP
jgi:hypothetical protein